MRCIAGGKAGQRENEDTALSNVRKLMMRLRDICIGNEGNSLAGGVAFVLVFLLLINMANTDAFCRKGALDFP
jgi:hypothetical protein